MAVLRKPTFFTALTHRFPLPAVLDDNPISRAERNTLSRAIRPNGWFAGIAYALGWLILRVAVIVAIVNIALVLLAALFRIPYAQVYRNLYLNPDWMLNIPTFLLFPVTLAAHFIRFSDLLTTSAGGLVREKRAGTWETLMLTGISARRVVWGKWWGAVQYHAPKFALLGLLQAGCIAFTMFITDYGNLLPAEYVSVYPTIFMVLFAFGLMLAYLALDVGLNAAAGVLGSLVQPARAAGAAFILRGGLIFAMIGIILWSTTPVPTGNQLPSGYMEMAPRAPLLGLVLATQIDQGVTASSAFGSVSMANKDGDLPYSSGLNLGEQENWASVLIVLAGLPLYAFFTWAMLRAAESLAVRGGLTPASSTQLSKSRKVKTLREPDAVEGR